MDDTASPPLTSERKTLIRLFFKDRRNDVLDIFARSAVVDTNAGD